MLKITLKNILFLILFALPNTVLSFGILFIINQAISGNKDYQESYLGWCFLVIIIFTYLLNIIFQKKLNQHSYHILYENEKNIFKRILETRLLTLEKHGTQRFYTAIEDLRIFATLPEVITHTINSLLMLFLCLVYMFSLSLYAGVSILVLIVCIAIVYFIVVKTMNGKVAVLRKFNEHYYNYVNDVVKGFKNLKVNSALSQNLLSKNLFPNRDQAKELDYNINYVFLSINLISQYGLYLIIGAILFVLPRFNFLLKEEIISFVVILLFVTGPISNLINMQNIYTRFSVANKRINNFLKDFAEEKEEGRKEMLHHTDFESLSFKNVSFQYENIAEQSFALNNINLNIRKGEVIFIVGGNGSGKSTFINILTGLYDHKDGEIMLNDQKLSSKKMLQSLISPVFTDNYVFSHNYDHYQLENNMKYQSLLELMEMQKIVSNTTEESARRNFSKGQSKRMSLIFALLEERPVLVLDEWAADQDPHFRKYFYEVLVPKFKKDGKTIIAVTHDDAYFKQADRIIKFDYGQIINDIDVHAELNVSLF
ncbi:cyclic peptide export ABC transporter [Chryseobacterium indologenes]|uniref:cyclic peptide export ABC transporter n=1 Tax=Chryseobacterium TaxID=59732 RepID=UPI00162AD133|nr:MULTISPECIES: cyclic peptide export ABC transporter [Chryseobacterium]MDM1553034.1 cyclic peptide export ABC transporter [Chryseobacterium indologenes]WET49160.1 cyclic peptide export ABC transporter [Chryseobacterium indologenes]